MPDQVQPWEFENGLLCGRHSVSLTFKCNKKSDRTIATFIPNHAITYTEIIRLTADYNSYIYWRNIVPWKIYGAGSRSNCPFVVLVVISLFLNLHPSWFPVNEPILFGCCGWQVVWPLIWSQLRVQSEAGGARNEVDMADRRRNFQPTERIILVCLCSATVFLLIF